MIRAQVRQELQRLRHERNTLRFAPLQILTDTLVITLTDARMTLSISMYIC